MINYITMLQTCCLLLLTHSIMKYNQVTDFNSKYWPKSTNQFIIIVVISYHIALYFNKLTILSYFWFWFSIFHHYIHAYKARLTIVESGHYTFDEFWHFINQLFCLYYLSIKNIDTFNVRLYSLFLLLYLIMLGLSFFNIKLNHPLYYLGSFMASFFLYSLQPVSNLLAIIFFGIFYLPIVYSITYPNILGKKLTLLNVAGCAFISESLTIFFLTNNIY